MVSNCANPRCAVPLRYLRDGRLFQFEVRAVSGDSAEGQKAAEIKKKPLRKVWHYWLCGDCCSSMTLHFDQLRGLKLTPLPQSCSQLAS